MLTLWLTTGVLGAGEGGAPPEEAVVARRIGGGPTAAQIKRERERLLAREAALAEAAAAEARAFANAFRETFPQFDEAKIARRRARLLRILLLA